MYKTTFGIGEWWNYLVLAHIYAIREENAKALEYLAKAVDLGLQYGWQDGMHRHPIFKNLKDDPEFKRLQQKAKDEKAALRVQVDELEARGDFVL